MSTCSLEADKSAEAYCVIQTRFRFRFIRDHTVSPHYEWVLYCTSVNHSTVVTSAQQQTEKLTAYHARAG